MEDIIQLEGIFCKGYGFSPKLVMIDNTLSIAAKGLYGLISSYSGKGKDAFPSRKTICYYLDISNDSLSKYINELTEKGYITVFKEKNKGKFANNIYRINLNAPCPKISDTEKIVHEKTVHEKIVHEKLDTNNNNNNNNNDNNNIYINNICKEATEIYHKYCTKLPLIQKMSKQRALQLEVLFRTITLSEFEQICKLANESEFLTGNNQNKWKADFDFIIREDKAIAILEGKYNKKYENKENFLSNKDRAAQAWLEED